MKPIQVSTIKQVRIASIIALWAFGFMHAWTPMFIAITVYGWTYMHMIERLENLLKAKLNEEIKAEEEKSDENEGE